MFVYFKSFKQNYLQCVYLIVLTSSWYQKSQRHLRDYHSDSPPGCSNCTQYNANAKWMVLTFSSCGLIP